jgi:hypothetical protein
MKLPIDAVVHLLHGAPHATLATLTSPSAPLPGYPYATVVPFVLDQQHCPVLLVSALAEHTKNLLVDSRVSLSVVETDASDVQTAARLSLIGDAERFVPDAALQARYLRYLPEAATHLQLDFMFIRIVPRRIRFIAGLGQMGWFESTDWASLPTLAAQQEASLLQALEPELPPSVKLLGADCFGIDYTQDNRRLRYRYPSGARLAEPTADLAQAFLAGLR